VGRARLGLGEYSRESRARGREPRAPAKQTHWGKKMMKTAGRGRTKTVKGRVERWGGGEDKLSDGKELECLSGDRER